MIDWTEASSVVLSGLVIVFFGLTILVLLLQLMGKIFKTTTATQQTPQPGKQNAPPPAQNVQSGIGGETVAAIAAAVAVVMSDSAPGTAYTIIGIRRQRDTRPVWGMAGLQQNTKPL